MIKHIKCDIFESGADIICHQVNCQGVMGSGIAKQVKTKYPEVYKAYMDICHYAKTPHDLLGIVLPCAINKRGNNGFSTIIMNLFAQENYGYDEKCYTDYDALRKCLEQVNTISKGNIIAIPYLMGCYRGGGDWNIVYKMIEEIFNNEAEVLICEYNGG